MSLSDRAHIRVSCGEIPEEWECPNCSMYDLLAQTAAKYPGQVAWVFRGKRCSYQRLLQQIDAAARGLHAAGIGPGENVAICLPNCPPMLACLYGLNRIGAVATMIHPLSSPGEIAQYTKQCRCKAVLTLGRCYETVASAVADLPEISVWVVDRKPKQGRGKLWKQVIRGGKQQSLPTRQAAAEDCALILFSSGTTGTPKGVRLSNGNVNALALQTIAASGLGSVVGRKVLAVLPNFHGFGLGIGIHTPLVGGAACLLMSQFSPEACAKILKRQKPDMIPGVPAMFDALLREKRLQKADLSFLRGVFSGGDSLPKGLRQKVDAFLEQHGCTVQIREGYGATECVAAACLNPPKVTKAGTVGLPLPHTLVKIVTSGTREACAAGVDGEICISGPTVMLGYLDAPRENAQALQTHADGRRWLHTGDLGHMDAEGYLYVTRRINRMIITNGYNVYPAQLEQALGSHDQVHLACVIGVADACRGQKVRAYIVPRPGVVADEALKQDILAHCAKFIAKYALPRELVFRQALPMTPVGKVAYGQLEAEAQEETT